MKSRLPEAIRPILAALLLAAALATAPGCSRNQNASLPVLSDPGAGLTLTLPPGAHSFTRQSAAQDRFLSRTPYGPSRTLLYLHAYMPPAIDPTALPVMHDDIAECILRDELGSFLTLETSFTNLPDQTPALLLFGRTHEPDMIAGFAFQCNKTRYVFIGLSGPDLTRADPAAFLNTTLSNLNLTPLAQTTFADTSQYQRHLIDFTNAAQTLDFIRNVFASRNTNTRNYTTAIGLAYLLAQDLQNRDPASPRLDETLALLNNMSAIRLADFLQGRHDYEIALGQRNATEAIAQANFLAALSFPFDAEARTLDKQRLRNANRLNHPPH